MVKNSRNKLTLPGGGIEPGENVLDALERETEEEIGYPLSEADTIPVAVGEYRFTAPDKFGVMHRRHWYLYSTSTDFVPADFMHDDDIFGVEALRREQIYQSKDVQDSAKDAAKVAFRSIEILQRSSALGVRRTRLG